MLKRRKDGYTVSKRKDGTWWARVVIGYGPEGAKRKAFYGRTREEVVTRAQEYRLKRDKGGFIPAGPAMTVNEWLTHWLDSFIKPSKEPKTYKMHEWVKRVHLVPAIGHIPLPKLTAARVRDLLKNKEESGLSTDSVRNIRGTLRTALNRAWKEGLIEQNVAAKTDPPKAKASDPVHLNQDKAKLFIE
ncbi:MAG: hypothetical protein H0W86_10595, partial [Armatimonadetes bacterium]|nr:hypothetical protein [Armatimonadota bacterium]